MIAASSPVSTLHKGPHAWHMPTTSRCKQAVGHRAIATTFCLSKHPESLQSFEVIQRKVLVRGGAISEGHCGVKLHAVVQVVGCGSPRRGRPCRTAGAADDARGGLLAVVAA